VLHEGRLEVPAGPGLGVTVDVEFLDSITYEKQIVEGVGLRSVS
jgi:L-alanine-DL-glutamate epimerase-like enolase superfamily enzyme